MEGSQSQPQGSGGSMEGGGSLKVHPHPHALDGAPSLNGTHPTSPWPQDSVTVSGGVKKGQPKKAAKPGHTLGSKPGGKGPTSTTPLQAKHGKGAAGGGGGAISGVPGSGGGQRKEATRASPGSAALDTPPSSQSPLHESFATRGTPSGAATSAGPSTSTLGDVLMLTELTMGEQRCGAHTQLLAALGAPSPGSAAGEEEGGAFAGGQDPGGAPKEPLSVPQEQMRHLRAGLREGQSRARERANAMGVALSKLDRWLHVISSKRKGRPEGAGLAPDRGDALGTPGDSPDAPAAFGAELAESPAKGLEGSVKGKSTGSRKPRTPGGAQRALSLATDGFGDPPHATGSPAQAEDGNGAASSVSPHEDGQERRPSAPTMKGKRSRPGAPGPLAGSGGSFKGDGVGTDRHHFSSSNSASRAPGGREAEGGPPRGKPSKPKPARGPHGMFVKASSIQADTHTNAATAAGETGGAGGPMGPERGRERTAGGDLFEGGVAGVVSADFFDQGMDGNDAQGHAPAGAKGGPRLATQRSRKVSRLMKVLSDGDELLGSGAEEGGSFLAGSPYAPGYPEAGTPRDGQDAAGTPREGQGRGRGRPKGRRAGAQLSARDDEEYVEEADVDMGDDELDEYEGELEDDLDAEFGKDRGGAHRGHARLSGASAGEEDYEAGGYAPRPRTGGGSKGGTGKLKRQGSDAKRKGGGFLAKQKGAAGVESQRAGPTGGAPGSIPNGVGDVLFSPSDGAAPAAGAVARGGSAPGKKGKKGKKGKGKVGRPQKRPVVPTGPTGEPVCSDEEELGLAVTATAEYYAHAASGPLWQFVEPFYGIPADKDLEAIAQLTECTEAEREGRVVPGFGAALKEQEGKRGGHRLRQKRVVAEEGTGAGAGAGAGGPSGAQKRASGHSQAPQSRHNGPTSAALNGAPDKGASGTMSSCGPGGGPGRGSVPRPPWCVAGQTGRHVTGGPRSSVSQRLVGLLLLQVDALSLTPSQPQTPLEPKPSQATGNGAMQSEPQPQGKGKGTTQRQEGKGKGDSSSNSSQDAHPPRHPPNGLTSDANGAPALNGAPTAAEMGQSDGPEWQKAWGGLECDARILVELQHLGLGDCVQAMTAAEHPEDDEVCAALRRCASSVESGGARSQALLARLKEELARQNQPHADERKREKILLDRLVESAYNRRTGCKVSSAPSALIPRTSHTVKAARNTSAQFAKRTLERVHAFESSTDSATAPATGGVLAAYPALREKLMQDKEPEAPPTPVVPPDQTPQLPEAASSGKQRGKGHAKGAMSAAATPPPLVPSTPGLLIDVDDGEGLMYDGPGGMSHSGGALLLREAVPARAGGVKRESNGGSAHALAIAGGSGAAWQGGGGGGTGRWGRGPSPGEWEEGRGRGRTVRLEDVGAAGPGAGAPLLARSASSHSDGAPRANSGGAGAAQDGLSSGGSFFGPVSAGSWKRKRSDRDGGSGGVHAHHSGGLVKGGAAGGESQEGGQRVKEKGKTKGQRNKGQRMALLPKIAGTPPTPLQAEAPTPDTIPPASPSPWLSEPGDDLFGPPGAGDSLPAVPVPTRRARNSHPGKSSKNRAQQLQALGMGVGTGIGSDSHATPSMLVDASPLPWTPRDTGTPEAYSLVDLPTEPLENTLGGMGMGMGMGMQSLEEPTPVDMGMPETFGTPGLAVGGGEEGFGEGATAGGPDDAPGAPMEGQEGGGLPEPPMPDGEGDMGWLSNLNMDNLGEGLDGMQGLAVPMDDLSELGF